MLRNMQLVVFVSLFFITGQAFGSMYGSLSMVRFGTNPPKPQINSFYELVTMNKMDNKIFSNKEKLRLFNDINERNQGYTPIQLLIDRPDATIEQVKVLLECGADINIPALIFLPEQKYTLWGSHKMGIHDTGETPPCLYGDKNKFKQYCGSPEVVNYVFQKMVKEATKKAIKKASLQAELEEDGESFAILPTPCANYNWPEMQEDEARAYLKNLGAAQREFEVFVKNLPSGAFDIFLNMQKMTQ